MNYFSLPTCGFTAQLVEHRTGVGEVTGSNHVEALTFVKFTAMITLHIHLQPQYSTNIDCFIYTSR